MKHLFSTIVFLVLALGVLPSAQSKDLPRSTPAAEGVEPQAITAFFDSLLLLPETEMHHVMVLRHGKVIAEMHPAPFRAQDAHTLYSESKTFTSLAIGLCIDDNLLRVTDRVANFFPELLPAKVEKNLADMTVWHLLTMTTGIKPDWQLRSLTTEWIKTFLAKDVPDAPGAKYQYDSMASFMLSAIVQRVTGKTVLQLLQERIFNPMEINDAQWEVSPDGICTGGWGLRMPAESQAKVGQLLLQKGEWNGKQLISKAYVEDATKVQVYPYKEGTEAHTKSPGYGYQIWRSEWQGSYRADGAFGQYVDVLPNEDMVVLINGLGYRTPKELKWICTVLMPGVKQAPLAANEKAQQKLETLCTSAALPTLAGKKTNKKRIGTTLNLNDVQVELLSETQLRYTYDGRTVTATYAGSGKSPATWHYETTATTPPYSIAPENCFGGLKPEYTTAAQFAWQTNGSLVIESYWVDFISHEKVIISFGKDGNVVSHKVLRSFSRDFFGNLPK